MAAQWPGALWNRCPIGTAVSTGTTRLIHNYTGRVLRNFLPSLVLAIVMMIVGVLLIVWGVGWIGMWILFLLMR